MFELVEKHPPSSREAQLAQAREDFAYAHDNGMTFEDLMTRINSGLGISWDRSAARRFIMGDVIGANRATKLSLEQVMQLRSLGAELRLQIEGVLSKDPLPKIQKDFFDATISLPLNAEQAQILTEHPELNARLQAELQRTAHHVFDVFKMGQNAVAPQTPKEP